MVPRPNGCVGRANRFEIVSVAGGVVEATTGFDRRNASLEAGMSGGSRLRRSGLDSGCDGNNPPTADLRGTVLMTQRQAPGASMYLASFSKVSALLAGDRGRPSIVKIHPQITFVFRAF